MATVKKIKKAQSGKNVPKGMVESEMFPGKMIPKKQSNYETGKSIGKPAPAPKKPVLAPKKKAKAGVSLKAVDSSKNPGLAKLPTPVRNKMGYQKSGGKVVKAMSGCKACWGSKMKKK